MCVLWLSDFSWIVDINSVHNLKENKWYHLGLAENYGYSILSHSLHLNFLFSKINGKNLNFNFRLTWDLISVHQLMFYCWNGTCAFRYAWGRFATVLHSKSCAIQFRNSKAFNGKISNLLIPPNHELCLSYTIPSICRCWMIIMTKNSKMVLALRSANRTSITMMIHGQKLNNEDSYRGFLFIIISL